jgi:hypothetical protein
MHIDIETYNNKQSLQESDICHQLAQLISQNLPEAESKVWHAHPVWFLNGNPIVGYSKQKSGIQLMFWSGQSFDEPALQALGKFKAANVVYTNASGLNKAEIIRWLEKSKAIQWDYKNIVKRKGELLRLS